MDVTSLLNVSCVGAGLGAQRRDSVASSTPSATGDTTVTSTAVPTPSPEGAQSRGPSGSPSPTRTRNRKPWDAGGYSLPWPPIDTKTIPSPAETRPAFLDDSPIEGSHTSLAGSPGSQSTHKLSGSRSSLSSSYSSSSYSTTNHSRISSLSTVSEFGSASQQPNNCYQSSPPPAGFKHQRFYSQQFNFRSNNNNNYQPDNFVTMAGRSGDHMGPSSRVHNTIESEQDGVRRTVYSVNSSRSNSIAAVMQPDSPSDAIFIRRGNGTPGEPSPVDGSNGSDVDGAADRASNSPAFDARQASHEAAGGLHHSHASTSQSPAANATEANHLEALSHFSPPVNGGALNDERVYSPESPDPHDNIPLFLSRSLVNMVIGQEGQQDRPYATLDDMWRLVDFRHPRFCVFKLDCNINADRANANWRKGMSHVFGRNKNETRAIPTDVWVHFCRKHYQRARYRNDEGYLRRIIYMIISQILRVEAWSNYNQTRGEPDKGKLMGWSLALRKRESEKRTKAEEAKKVTTDSGRGMKRKAGDITEEHEEGDAPAQVARDDGSRPANLVVVPLPAWLLELCTRAPGGEPVVHSSAEIIGFILRLFEDLRPIGKGDLPDFEILPVIQGETAKSKAKAAKPKKGLGRRPSVAEALRMRHRDRVGAHPAEDEEDDADFDEEGMPFTREDAKRARRMPPQADVHYASRTMVRTVPEVRPIVYSERPHNEWMTSSIARPNGSASAGQPASIGPLPAPQGYGQDTRANTHQRSVSDAGNAGYWSAQPGTASYTPYSTYPHADSYYSVPTPDRTRNNSYSLYSQPSTMGRWGVSGYGQEGYGASMGQVTHAKHVRHQSTPTTRPMASGYGQQAMPSTTQGMAMTNGFIQTRFDTAPAMGGYYQHYNHGHETQSTYQPVSGDSYSHGYANVNGGGDLPNITRALDRSYSQADFPGQQSVTSMAPRSIDSRGYQTSGDGYQDFGTIQQLPATRGSDSDDHIAPLKSEADAFSRRV